MKNKTIRKCQTCANSVNGVHCTMSMQADYIMSEHSRVYKKCPGYKVYVAPATKEEVVKTARIDYDKLGAFGRFLWRGGHYSFRTDKVF